MAYAGRRPGIRQEEFMDYALIMAGGSGTRLWPLSREGRPKQSLHLVGERSMFQHAIERLAPLFPTQDIWVVTRSEHASLLHAQSPELPANNLILEPQGRGTAPAIGLGAIHLRRADPQAVMVVLTADHYITHPDRFRQVLAAALEAARRGHLVTLGIKPANPSTGYGYIEQGSSLGEVGGFPVFHVQHFTEKPDRQTAARMVASGIYSWNSGMFIWQVQRILAEFERQMPEFYARLLEVEAAIGTPDYEAVLGRIWPQIPKQTIDYGVMEGAQDVVVIPADFGWTDIGSWASLVELLPTDAQGNTLVGEHLSIDTQNTLVFGGERLIATVGVRDLVIVDAGDALLVCHKDHEQRVRELVDLLKAQNHLDLV
jgi:mannose-1-phosphate guanylyltransferase